MGRIGDSPASDTGWFESNSRVRKKRLRESIRNHESKSKGKNQLVHGVIEAATYVGMFELAFIIGNGLAAIKKDMAGPPLERLRLSDFF